MSEARMARAVSFGAWASEYDECRRSYPDAAVGWLVNDARRVIEAGAGTGKLTDSLVKHDDISPDVTEIDGRMLRVIHDRHPTLPVYETGATSLPVNDAAVDAVLVADAWHWFPKEEAAAEVTRVLRPGGWLGCVWNDMAATTPDWQWEAMQLNADIADHVRDMAVVEARPHARPLLAVATPVEGRPGCWWRLWRPRVADPAVTPSRRLRPRVALRGVLPTDLVLTHARTPVRIGQVGTSGDQQYMAGYNAGRRIALRTGSTEAGRRWLDQRSEADIAYVAGYEWALWDYEDANGLSHEQRPASAG